MFVKQMREMMFQRRRHCELITSSGFSLNRPAADRFIEFCRGLPANTGDIPMPSDKQLASEPLLRYGTDREAVTMTINAFRRHFNDKYVKEIPRDLSALRLAAEDIAVEEMDLQAAQTLGVDRTPKFTEERKGFEGFQVLDLFEKEVLIPKLGIGPPDIERYYREHISEFRGVTKIRGRLLKFDTVEKAAEWRQRASVIPTTDEELELRAGETIPGLEHLQPHFMKIPEGSTLGPIKQGQMGIVLIKQKNLEEGAIPLAVVADKIRGTLVRQKLDEKEIQLAAELSTRLKVEDHLDYKRYGLSAAGSTESIKR